MFYDDILLVERMIAKYGLRKPFADLGGLRAKDVTVARYELTLASGVQKDRYVKLDSDPFAHIAGENYAIINPQYGHDEIEHLPAKYPNYFGTAVCLNVIEHVVNPFDVFWAFSNLMQKGGLVIVTTVFSFPLHPSPLDNFRYSPDCLKMLGEYAGFEVLETGFHLVIWGDAGIKDIKDGHPQEIQAVFCVLRKPK